MIRAGISQQIVHRARHAAAGVVSPEYHAAYLGQHNGAGTLGARLQGDVQRGQQQPVFTYLLECALQRQQLRMRGRVPALHRRVVSLSQHLAVRHHDRSYRDLLPNGGRPRQPESGLHSREIAGRGGASTH